MIPMIIQIAENFKSKVSTVADKNDSMDIKDLSICFGMDIIGNIGFGLDVNTIDNPNHSFREIEKHITDGAFLQRIRLIGAFFCPQLLEMFFMKAQPSKFQNYMLDLVRDTMDHRKSSGTIRKDFIQLLLELQETGKLQDGESFSLINSESGSTTTKCLTLEQCAAQVALFYLAGFDTTSSTIAYTIFELSRKPELQKRLQEEIDEMMEKNNNQITYENIKDMPFLEACTKESVRKYPTLPFLNRICTKDYKIEELDLTVPKGTPVVISLLGLMRDPEYFPGPDNYLPDRFTENEQMYDPDAFIPFGEGPRACIGIRMGKIVTKIALISLFQKYNFECMDDRELEIVNYGLTISINGGIYVRVSNRQK